MASVGHGIKGSFIALAETGSHSSDSTSTCSSSAWMTVPRNGPTPWNSAITTRSSSLKVWSKTVSLAVAKTMPRVTVQGSSVSDFSRSVFDVWSVLFSGVTGFLTRLFLNFAS